MKHLFNRFALAFLRLIPLRLARHVLFLLRHDHAITDRWGYHVRPIHYYDPLPDFSLITAAETQTRREPSTINFDFPAQRALVRRLGKKYREEIEEIAQQRGSAGFDFDNGYFAGFDAALYYALLRDLKPKHIIEIGAGYSTRIADKALERNQSEGQEGKLICVEPYPESRLTDAELGIQLVQRPVESLDLMFFQRLQSGDVLFVDSSHTVKFRNDVCREFLEILPALSPGVVVHVHDIFFPHDYPAEWLMKKRIAFNEQYLLEAFLSYNSTFEILSANYWLCLEHLADVAELWPCARATFRPGSLGAASFWMNKTT